MLTPRPEQVNHAIDQLTRAAMQPRMAKPRLLFVAYKFPPVDAISCVRAANIVKYLKRMGWDVTVVTPHPAPDAVAADSRLDRELRREGIKRVVTDHDWRIIERKQTKGLVKVLASALGRRLIWYLDIENSVGWLKPATAACQHLTAADVDVVMATGPPFTSFELARRLADRLGRPYVLDYRDPWTDNPSRYRYRPPRRVLVEKERSLLEGAAAVTIVSPSWAEALDRQFQLGSKLHVITNGYDPEELAGVNRRDHDHFAIVYAGVFYPGKRTITPVMAALKQLEDAPATAQLPWKFHYYGQHQAHVCQEASRFGVMDRVVLHGRVSRDEALEAVRSANVAVVITFSVDSGSLADRGIVTGKVFEPLGLGTPILLVAPAQSDACAIIEGSAHSRSFVAGDCEGMARYLADLMHAAPRTDAQSNGEYSWPVLAERVESILACVAAKQQPLAQRVDG